MCDTSAPVAVPPPSPKSHNHAVISSVEGEPSSQAQEPAPLKSTEVPGEITEAFTEIIACGKPEPSFTVP